MIERQQNIRYSMKQKLAANFTMGMSEIRNGFDIIKNGMENVCENCGGLSPQSCITCSEAN